MGLRDELLKPIWHAFTALDLDKCGKVSKSQLKVRFEAPGFCLCNGNLIDD
uniref:SWAP70 N-terminal EF-hand domain-containing protein n=1 Tax=Anguilla anguilla TaxID=7936 RepID=A0A0E9Q241_ANGAN